MEHGLSEFKRNELETNILVVKILWGIFIAGFTLLGALIVTDILRTTWLEMILMAAGMGGAFLLATLICRYYQESGFVKYVLTAASFVGFGFIVWINEVSLALSPFWVLPIVITILYFNLPLVIFSGALGIAGNAVFVFTDPGRGMEAADISALSANSLVFLLTTIAIVFASYRGRTLVERVIQFEMSSRDLAEFNKAIVSKASDTCEQTTSLSENIARATENLTSSFEEVASANNELASSSQELKEHTRKVSNYGEQAAKEAEQGKQALEDFTEQMETIRNSFDLFRESITNLAGKVNNIEHILEVINSIAEETNMLALNAAIEAARAGEHGTGFAVVADEVRKLANQAAKSSGEISEIVQDIQGESDTVVSTIEDRAKEVEAGNKTVQSTRDVINNVLLAIEEISSEIGEIASAAEQLSESVESIAAASQEQASTVTSINESTETMRKLSREMHTQLQMTEEQNS